MTKDGLGRLVLLTAFLLISHCVGTSKKQRLVQKDHVVASKKVVCERVDGEKYPDVDVLLTINMGERCDFSKPFSITDYRSFDDIPYVIYCCNLLETKITNVVEVNAPTKPVVTTPNSDSEANVSPSQPEVRVISPGEPASGSRQDNPTNNSSKGSSNLGSNIKKDPSASPEKNASQ